MKIKVYLLWGRNYNLNVISAGVYATRAQAEAAAQKFYDEYKIEEQLLTPVEVVEEDEPCFCRVIEKEEILK